MQNTSLKQVLFNKLDKSDIKFLFYWILHKNIGYTSKVVISISSEKKKNFEGVDNSPPGFCPMRQWEQHDIAKITLPYVVNS